MAKFLRKRSPMVLLDVDTQFDMLPANVHQRRKLSLKWRRVMAWARMHRLSIVSLSLAGREDDNVLGQMLCVENTPGHEKVGYTVCADHFHYGAEHCLDLLPGIMDEYRQVMFERREFDPFQCDRFERLVNTMDYDHYVVLGGAFEASVKLACLGLLARNKKVTLVYDAISSIFDSEYDYVMKKLEAKGVKMETTASLTGQKPAIIRPNFAIDRDILVANFSGDD